MTLIDRPEQVERLMERLGAALPISFLTIAPT